MFKLKSVRLKNNRKYLTWFCLRPHKLKKWFTILSFLHIGYIITQHECEGIKVRGCRLSILTGICSRFWIELVEEQKTDLQKQRREKSLSFRKVFLLTYGVLRRVALWGNLKGGIVSDLLRCLWYEDIWLSEIFMMEEGCRTQTFMASISYPLPIQSHSWRIFYNISYLPLWALNQSKFCIYVFPSTITDLHI